LADFIALYRGQTVSDAELIAVSAEPRLVRCLFAKLLGEPLKEKDNPHRERVVTLEAVRDEE
jgi:hypothetical protein